MRHLPLPKGIRADITIVFVIIMILALVLLAALLYPQYNIFTFISGKTPYNICRQSVEAASLMRLGQIELSPFLKCQTQQVTITKNDPDAAKKVIADALYNCYYQFGRGEKELFNKEGKFCFVCSTIDFEADAAKIKDLPEFQKYLFETLADRQHTYASYIYKEKVDRVKKELGSKYNAPLSRQKFGTIFTYDKWRTAENKDFEATLNKIAAVGSTASLALFLSGVGTPFAFLSLSASGLALVGGYAVETFGEYSQISTAMIVPYSSESLSKLGCTQKIAPKSA